MSHQLKHRVDPAAPTKQAYFTELFHNYALRTSYAGLEPNFLTVHSRMLLETVMSYSGYENAVPSSNETYATLANSILSNESKCSINVAKVIRSMADIANKEQKLYELIVSELGFCQKQRCFKNAPKPNLNLNNNAEEDIGEVTLSEFLIKFGAIYGLTRQLPNKEEISRDKLNPFNNQHSLISPICSQEQIENFKKIERSSILSAFHSAQQSNRLFDSSLQSSKQIKMEERDELEANEKIQVDSQIVLNKKQYSLPQASQSSSNKQHGQYKQEYQGISEMLNNLQKQQHNLTKISPLPSLPETQKQFSFSDKLKSPINTQQNPFTESFRRYESQNRLQPEQQLYSNFMIHQGESLLSSHNTPMKTPHINDTYYQMYFSEQKQPRVQKNLFSHKVPESPMSLKAPTENIANSKYLLFNHYNQAKPGNVVGIKREAEAITNLEAQVKKENENFSTPVQNSKRQKVEKYEQNIEEDKLDLNKDDSSFDENSEEKNEGGQDQIANRKMRGLKILSVKVKELVQDKVKTTYKDVANELIVQLRENKKNKEDLQGLGVDEISDQDDDYMSDESPVKKGAQKDDLPTSQLKWEKNVRRRVYDALNVLYAAGVLKKEGKHVSCDTRALQLTSSKTNDPKSNPSSAQKQHTSVQDQKMLQQIEHLKLQLQAQKQRNEDKRDYLSEQFKNYISYKHLIDRNIINKDNHNHERKIYLPFILVSTKDSPDNEVEISFGEANKSLNIAMKKPMKCIGDADTLMKLKFYKVEKEKLSQIIPECNKTLGLLNEKHLEEILI